jgi:AcrR family transcriptional regulator
MRKKIKDEVILEAALKVFSKYGYRKATLEDIAGEMGMTAANIYAYAQSKRELYEKTVSCALLRWQEKVRIAVGKKRGAAEKMTTLCSSALYYLREDPELSALLESDPSIFPMFPTVDPYEDINAASARMIESVLNLGSRTGEFRRVDSAAAARVIFEIFRSFIIRAYVHGETEFIDENLPQAMDLLFKGIENK